MTEEGSTDTQNESNENDIADDEDTIPLEFLQESFGDLDFIVDMLPRIALVHESEQAFVSNILIRDSNTNDVILSRTVNLSGIIDLIESLLSHTFDGIKIAQKLKCRVSVPHRQNLLMAVSRFAENSSEMQQLLEEILVSKDVESAD